MRILFVFVALFLLLPISSGVAATGDTTNINAIVEGLNDLKTSVDSLFRLDEMVTKWNGTNYEIFSPAIDGLVPMIGYGGVAERKSRVAEDLLVKLHTVSLPKLIELTRSKEERLRWSSAQILGRIRPVEAKSVAALKNLANDEVPYVRRCSYEALISLGDQCRGLTSFLSTATNEADACNRIIIDAALAKFTGQADPYVGRIASCLTNDDFSVQFCAAYQLGSCGLLASNVLLVVMKTGDPRLKFYAATTLGKIGVKNSEVIAVLTEALKNDSENEVKRSAAVALGQIGLPATNAVPILIETLRKADVQSKGNCTGWWVAAKALGEIQNDEAIQGLTEALKNSDPDIRRTAEKELQAIKNR